MTDGAAAAGNSGRGSHASCNSNVTVATRVDVAAVASVTTDGLGCTVQNW